MPTKYKQLIEEYCAQHGIAVPPGFARNTPCRYAIIRTNLTPPKLIATTWSKTADVLYYIEHFLQPELDAAMAGSIRIFDFKEGVELAYAGGKQLGRIGTLPVMP
jgi:hypothetical protein